MLIPAQPATTANGATSKLVTDPSDVLYEQLVLVTSRRAYLSSQKGRYVESRFNKESRGRVGHAREESFDEAHPHDLILDVCLFDQHRLKEHRIARGDVECVFGEMALGAIDKAPAVLDTARRQGVGEKRFGLTAVVVAKATVGAGVKKGVEG